MTAPVDLPLDLEDTLLGPLVEGRVCGGCTACCDLLKIDTPELEKPAETPCIHRCAEGCAIHATRPPICRAWFCGWRRMPMLPEAARPDRSGLMVSLDVMRAPRNCLEGVAVVVRAVDGAAAFETAIAADILDPLCERLVPVWLSDGTKKMLAHPAAEVARHVIAGEAGPPGLAGEIAAWRARYGVFAG